MQQTPQNEVGFVTFQYVGGLYCNLEFGRPRAKQSFCTRLPPETFEMPEEVEDADEFPLLAAFGDFVAALERGGHGVFRSYAHLSAGNDE